MALNNTKSTDYKCHLSTVYIHQVRNAMFDSSKTVRALNMYVYSTRLYSRIGPCPCVCLCVCVCGGSTCTFCDNKIRSFSFMKEKKTLLYFYQDVIVTGGLSTIDTCFVRLFEDCTVPN